MKRFGIPLKETMGDGSWGSFPHSSVLQDLRMVSRSKGTNRTHRVLAFFKAIGKTFSWLVRRASGRLNDPLLRALPGVSREKTSTSLHRLVAPCHWTPHAPPLPAAAPPPAPWHDPGSWA